MRLEFREDTHSYYDPEQPDKKWISVTTLTNKFCEPFDAIKVAEKVRTKKKSKWYGMSVDEIVQAWNNENKRSTDLGTWYHNQRENDINGCDTLTVGGNQLPIYRSIYNDDVKVSPEQTLVDGVYPEHFVYLNSCGICGQSDLVTICNSEVEVLDFKTCKKIDTESVTVTKGRKKKMLAPVQHLDDCNFNHYALQLSFYMYMILKHNPIYKAGKMMLQHVMFELDGEDKYGYPIVHLENGEPIVKDVVRYDVPYLKNEVENIIKYLQLNPQLYDKTI